MLVNEEENEQETTEESIYEIDQEEVVQTKKRSSKTKYLILTALSVIAFIMFCIIFKHTDSGFVACLMMGDLVALCFFLSCYAGGGAMNIIRCMPEAIANHCNEVNEARHRQSIELEAAERNINQIKHLNDMINNKK